MNNLSFLKGTTIGAIALVISSCSASEANLGNPTVGQSVTPQAAPVVQAVSNEQTTSPKSLSKSLNGEFQKVTVVGQLERPWGMAWLPDQSLLITERVGRVQHLRDGKIKQVKLELPNLFASGQAGLMDISLHPRFSENKLVYLTYSTGNADANRTSILRTKFDGEALVEPQVIFAVNPVKSGTQHFGSRISWLDDGTMLVAIGDGGNPPLELNGELIRNQAQNLNSHLGKIIRIKDDGSIPTDNPFVNRPNTDPAIWSYGHRNIQGLFVDRKSGQVWSTEHGSRGGDELNLITSGKNYGWPVVSYSQEYLGGDVSAVKSRADVPEPKVVWTPSIAPSGLTVYNGDRFPTWQGQIFAGGLVSREVLRIRFENNKAIQESIPIGQRVRDVREGADGLIYILTDEQNGQLIRLEPKS